MAEEVIVTFSRNYKLGNQDVNQIALREPLVKDMELIEGHVGSAISSQNQLIRVLSGLDTATDAQFGLMAYKDYVKVQDALEGLTS